MTHKSESPSPGEGSGLVPRTGPNPLPSVQELANRGRYLAMVADLELSPAAFEIATARAPAWEYFLFAQVLDDEVAALSELQGQALGDAALEPSDELIDDARTLSWMKRRLTEPNERILHRLEEVVQQIGPALGPPGEPGNARALVKTARRLGRVYRRALRWTVRVRSARLAPRWGRAQGILQTALSDVITQIEGFGPELRSTVNRGLAQLEAGEEMVHVRLIIEPQIPAGFLGRLNAAFRHAMEQDT